MSCRLSVGSGEDKESVSTWSKRHRFSVSCERRLRDRTVLLDGRGRGEDELVAEKL